MACSSRISRILPTGLPLTWDATPAEYQPLSPPSLPSANSKPVQSGSTKESLSPRGVNVRRSPNSPLSTIPPILPRILPFKFLSLKSRSDARRPATKQERYTCKDSLACSKDRRYAIGHGAPQKRNASSSCAQSLKHNPQENVRTHVNSSPPTNAPPDETRWMKVASSVHQCHGKQIEQSRTHSTPFRKTHRHKYSHVVQTDALAPNPSCSAPSGANSSQPPPYEEQPWATDNHEIDWATYYSIKPLPASTAWSRPEAIVDDVYRQWTGKAKKTGP